MDITVEPFDFTGLEPELLLEMYRQMTQAREFEEQLYYLFLTRSMPGTMHQATGQEAVAIGVISTLNQDDYVTSTHRGHAHCIAKGVDLKAMMAEMFAKRTGVCKGMGGSMHLCDFSKGMLGAFGIVGAGIPIAAGAALSAYVRDSGQVAVSFFGDGAVNAGVFHEALNMAALWKLPAVFVCPADPGDAYILADILRTDGHRFRPLRVPSDQTKAMRAAVRTRDDLVATRVQLANQLRSLLETFWAGAACIFADVDTPIALDFLDSYPTPESASRLGPKRLERFLKRSAYCGRRAVEDLLERLRSAPAGHAGELENETKGQLVRCLVAVLRPLVAQIRELDGLIAAHLSQHPDGEIIRSFPRTGTINAAQILAELGDDRLRFATEAQLAAEAGVAPVTHTSGKHRGVACRFACN